MNRGKFSTWFWEKQNKLSYSYLSSLRCNIIKFGLQGPHITFSRRKTSQEGGREKFENKFLFPPNISISFYSSFFFFVKRRNRKFDVKKKNSSLRVLSHTILLFMFEALWFTTNNVVKIKVNNLEELSHQSDLMRCEDEFSESVIWDTFS